MHGGDFGFSLMFELKLISIMGDSKINGSKWGSKLNGAERKKRVLVCEA